MSKAKRRRKLVSGSHSKAKRHVSIAQAPWNGDHGTGTAAATAGTVVEPMADSPNRMAVRKRVNVIDTLTSLSMRQQQAAKEIQEAYCRVEMQSSGSALKEQVDASPKPDAVIAAQVDAMSRLAHAMSAVPSAMRDVVEHVCWENRQIATISKRTGYNRMADFKVAMDLVANRLRY